jgi:Tol biopolymer transport system component
MVLVRVLAPSRRPAAATSKRRGASFVFAASSAALGLVLALWAGPPALAHPPGVTERISVGPAGVAADDASTLAAVSADGRFVAFWSFASNLVAGDTNGTSDVFVHDRLTDTTERASVDSRERQSVGGDAGGVLDTNLGRPAISGDGRYVAFASTATNLVKGDRNQAADIFVRDRVTGTTERISMASRRVEANSDSSGPAITPDGRLVAFSSFANNLAVGDANFATDVFVIDRQAGTTELISVNSAEEQANAGSGGAAITPDGRFVAFGSDATNLIPGDVDDFASDVYLRDRATGTTEGISTIAPPSGFVRHSGAPAISADGQLVAFNSWDSNLVTGDTNDRYDIFVLNRGTGAIERVSVNDAGVEGNNDSLGPALSADGRFVAFSSDADNLVPGDGNFDVDVFVHDRTSHTTVRVSVRTDGTETGFELASFNASISANGQVIAFESEGALVPEDSGFPVDIFTHQEAP